ncbi:MAG: SAP domain-containing protein [Lentisphaeria bacterium]
MGKIKNSDIRKKASDLGVTFDKDATQTELIQAIQTAEGNCPCFATSMISSCGQESCCWRGDCLTTAVC